MVSAFHCQLALFLLTSDIGHLLYLKDVTIADTPVATEMMDNY